MRITVYASRNDIGYMEFLAKYIKQIEVSKRKRNSVILKWNWTTLSWLKTSRYDRYGNSLQHISSDPPKSAFCYNENNLIIATLSKDDWMWLMTWLRHYFDTEHAFEIGYSFSTPSIKEVDRDFVVFKFWGKPNFSF